MRHYQCFILASLFTLVSAGCQEPHTPKTAIDKESQPPVAAEVKQVPAIPAGEFVETFVGEFPRQNLSSQLHLSEDGRKIISGWDISSSEADKPVPAWDRPAYAGARSASWGRVEGAVGYCLFVDGKPGPMYWEVIGEPLPNKPGLLGPSLHFSPDGKNFVFVARKNRDELAKVFLNHEPGPGCDQLTSAIAFSADSKHIAYATLTNNIHRFVVDGRASVEYELIRCRLPRFDENNTVEFLGFRRGKLYRVQYRAE